MHVTACPPPLAVILLPRILALAGTVALGRHGRLPAPPVKPRPPWNVTFLWSADGESVSISCPGHAYSGLDYEVQHRDAWDSAWQTTSGPRCDITVGGLNPEICYDFRVRARPRDFHYGTEAMPSEWTGVMSRRGAGPPASCAPGPAPAVPAPPWPLPLACCLAAMMTLALLLILLRLRRVKAALLPCVPDPRGSFPGLFELHHGNFQALPLTTKPHPQAWIAAHAQATAPTLKPQEEEEGDDVICPQSKWARPGEGSAPSGGAAWTPAAVDDSGYMTL
ncbi:cytokine receptor-like factor 2 [Mastomys coucha]|uniref:cytokine receptor-like factor 2 n=1 Tax=Mastomys coucha TaxID=35658 RepID=UPI0012626739|nr:cytokine receptor-like factor 2 [Mastomys coucha]